jgi:hypothetical protein
MDAKILKKSFTDSLCVCLDERMLTMDFKRRTNSDSYKRQIGNVLQIFNVNISLNPAYKKGALVHVYPRIELEIPDVNVTALRLVDNNRSFAPNVTLNRPFEHLVPLDKRKQWYVYGLDEYEVVLVSVWEQFELWGISFFNDYNSVDSIIKGYDASDKRPVLQRNWYLCVIAAAVVLGRKDKAIEIAEKEFSTDRDRRKYEAVFRNLMS